ncbi:SocA family protein [Pseudoflavitalea sp. X16]|uniref:Panacea domain-containing protein n=1 Tax=Paraflavitalea devenefica TaxID=2716334 RepID=UPI0014207C04|nr:type II toxin-antitoxin system antitoxin SocA domain-containing protein [Paraflavitalea devenefica]NII28569.1 SocA family protein [Paraflavitalea devenefica]
MEAVQRYSLIADYFIALSNERQSPITNLKLQKLVYYAQAWHMVLVKRDLIAENFQAWVHGPVIPALYNDYREFGWKPLMRDDLTPDAFTKIKEQLPADTLQLLQDVCYEYFGLEAFELEKLTHNEDPWLITRKGLADDAPSDRIIDKALIKGYYSKFSMDEQD